MVQELRIRNQSQQLYVRLLSEAWRNGVQLYDPSVWLLRDPDAESKMLRDADIAQAIGFRCQLIAGRQWDIVPKVSGSPRADMAVVVGKDLLGDLQGFTDARMVLARAFFHGQRYSSIHGQPKKLTIGDGKERTWWVPTRLEDLDKRNFRIVPTNDGTKITAHWEKWNVASEQWEVHSTRDEVDTIRHTYQDDQSTLGHGRALREALGWWWYAKENVFAESLQAVERFAQGILHARVDGARDAATGLPNEEVINDWIAVLEDLRARNVLVSDKSDEVEVIQGSAEGWQLLKDIREELNTAIKTLILCANLTTSADKGGSYALGEIQENSTESLIQTDREVLEETLSRDLVGCLWWHNWANLVELDIHKERPRFAIKQEKRLDPQVRATVAATLNQMGVDIAADELYEQCGFRKPGDGEDIIAGSVPMPVGSGLDPFGGGGDFSMRGGRAARR